MSPFLQRKLRAMTTVFVLAFCVIVAAGLAWWTYRRDAFREPPSSACSEVLTTVFADSSNTPDADLLARLLEHRTSCVGDAAYVDQMRRLMLNTQQIGPARALLEDAGRRDAFTPDELKAEFAWVDLAAAHFAWVNDQPARAEELRAHAITAANELRARWPEWPLPYLLLDEAERTSHANPSPSQVTDYFQLGRKARERLVTGAALRNFSPLQAAVFTFVTAAIGMIALCAGVSGLLTMREMASLPTSFIGRARPGYVELKGSVHVLPGTDAAVTPHSHTRVVWYEEERISSSKNARRTTERSAQPFLLRDPTGEAVIDPRDINVRTRHTRTTFGNSWSVSSSRRITERMLMEDDAVYVLGELIDGQAPNGKPARIVRVAENGRELLVSNFDEEELVFFERLWFWAGSIVFALALLMLAWAYYQRYHVTVVPGVL